jgi:hypothetical protein
MKAILDKGIYGIVGIIVGALITYLVTAHYYMPFINAANEKTATKLNQQHIDEAIYFTLRNSLIAFQYLDYTQAKKVIAGNMKQYIIINNVSKGSEIHSNMMSVMLLALKAGENNDETTKKEAEKHALKLCRLIIQEDQCKISNLYETTYEFIDDYFGVED